MTLFTVSTLAYSACLARDRPFQDPQYEQRPSLQEVFDFKAKLKARRRVVRHDQKSVRIGFVDDGDGSLDDEVIRKTSAMALKD